MLEARRCGLGRDRRRLAAIPAEQVPVPLLLLSGPPLQTLDQVARAELLERVEDVGEAFEAMKPLGALLQLADRLRAPQHEDAQERRLAVREPERLVEELTVLRSAAAGAARNARPAPAREPLECLVDLALVVRDDRIAVRRLVAGEPQGVERQRVLIGRRALLLEQASKHTELDVVRIHAGSVRGRLAVASWLLVGRSVRPSNVHGVSHVVSIRSSYWVAERLLAGPYPRARDAEDTARRMLVLAEQGVTRFVDLTHPADGLEPYEALLAAGATRVAHPIADFGTTTIPHMTRILDDIDDALAEGRACYVHCWGGVGRTGTVVGCWLVRHGLDDGDAIARIAALRRDLADASRVSPETSAQRAMVTAWKRGR
jgi:predicted protein tyrosine phosphatase